MSVFYPVTRASLGVKTTGTMARCFVDRFELNAVSLAKNLPLPTEAMYIDLMNGLFVLKLQMMNKVKMPMHQGSLFTSIFLVR